MDLEAALAATEACMEGPPGEDVRRGASEARGARALEVAAEPVGTSVGAVQAVLKGYTGLTKALLSSRPFLHPLHSLRFRYIRATHGRLKLLLSNAYHPMPVLGLLLDLLLGLLLGLLPPPGHTYTSSAAH